MLPKNLGNPYFDTSTGGAEEATEEFGGTFEEVGPSEASPDLAGAVHPDRRAAGRGRARSSRRTTPRRICDALNEARDAGVKVVTFDSDTNPDCRDLFINQATAEGIAKVQVDLIAEQIGDAGQIAILSASANATNQNAWIEMMEELLAANHPDIELVETVYGDDDDQTSFDKTAALLQTYPELKGIISPTTVGISAAARYLSTSEYKGKVALTGLGTPNQMREYVEDGTVTAFALWNPADLGYLAAFAAQALIDRRDHRRRGRLVRGRQARLVRGRRRRRPCCSATRTSSTRRTSATSTSKPNSHGARPIPLRGSGALSCVGRAVSRARRSGVPRLPGATDRDPPECRRRS